MHLLAYEGVDLVDFDGAEFIERGLHGERGVECILASKGSLEPHHCELKRVGDWSCVGRRVGGGDTRRRALVPDRFVAEFTREVDRLVGEDLCIRIGALWLR